jgi:hypothetical protein
MAGQVAVVVPCRPRAVARHGVVEEDGGLPAPVLGAEEEICTTLEREGRDAEKEASWRSP